MVQRKMDASKNLKLWLKRNFWECLLAGFILISFGLFLLALGDYGVSYDEPIFYVYADRMVQVYKNMAVGESISTLLDFNEHPYYGPAYLVGGRILIAVFQTVFSRLEIYDAWHIVNFLTFLLGAVLVFMLTRRVASKPASLIAACLYLTQPLLWGHGVMNPKDIPFMTVFLAAMVTGLKMVDIFNHPDSERQMRTVSKTRWLILAGVVSGLTVANRVLGPAAAGLVLFMLLCRTVKKGGKSLLGLLG